jgi:hypothetical protein
MHDKLWQLHQKISSALAECIRLFVAQAGNFSWLGAGGYCINNGDKIFILRELEPPVLLRPTSDSEGHFQFMGAAYMFSDSETPPWLGSDSPSGAITLI